MGHWDSAAGFADRNFAGFGSASDFESSRSEIGSRPAEDLVRAPMAVPHWRALLQRIVR